MNGFKVGGEIDIYIAKVSGWSQNKGPSFESNQYPACVKEGIKQWMTWPSLSEEEEEIWLCFYDIFLPYIENIFVLWFTYRSSLDLNMKAK